MEGLPSKRQCVSGPLLLAEGCHCRAARRAAYHPPRSMEAEKFEIQLWYVDVASAYDTIPSIVPRLEMIDSCYSNYQPSLCQLEEVYLCGSPLLMQPSCLVIVCVDRDVRRVHIETGRIHPKVCRNIGCDLPSAVGFEFCAPSHSPSGSVIPSLRYAHPCLTRLSELINFLQLDY